MSESVEWEGWEYRAYRYLANGWEYGYGQSYGEGTGDGLSLLHPCYEFLTEHEYKESNYGY